MTVEKKPGRPAAKLIAVAALAGVLAGAAAVYVMESRSGNGGGTEVAAGGQCEAAKGKAAALTPFLTGQVAAMMAADQPRPLPTLAFNGPDGKPFSFHVLIDSEFRPDTVDAFQLIAKTWKQAGLDAKLDLVSDDAWNNRDTDPKNDAAVWVGENGCGQLPLLNLDRWVNDFSGWSLGNWDGWAAWDKRRIDPSAKLPDGVTPVTPPKGVQRMYEIRSLIPTATGDQQAALMKEFGDLAADNFLEIGIALPEGFYRAVRNDLHNATPLIEGWYYPGPAPSNFAQYYVQK